jgi:hypothetical protein
LTGGILRAPFAAFRFLGRGSRLDRRDDHFRRRARLQQRVQHFRPDHAMHQIVARALMSDLFERGTR